MLKVNPNIYIHIIYFVLIIKTSKINNLISSLKLRCQSFFLSYLC